MKHLLLAAALLGMTLALPAAAQTITPEPPANSFYSTNLPFLVGANPTQSQLAGLNVRDVSGFGPGYVYDFCADFLTGNDDLATFDVSPGFGTGLTGGQQDQIEALFSNSLPMFIQMLNAYIVANGNDWAERTEGPLGLQFNQLVGYAGGMQVALWEIVHESTGDLSIDSEGSVEGDFRVELIDPSNPRAGLARTNAETFLQNIGSGTWTNVGGINYFYANPQDGTAQDRLWMTVPEPASVLLGSLGMLALLRRRRA